MNREQTELGSTTDRCRATDGSWELVLLIVYVEYISAFVQSCFTHAAVSMTGC